MLVLHGKGDVTARSVAQPFQKIFLPTTWALTLARRRHASCRRFLLATLPIAPLLLTPTHPPSLGRPVTPAGFDVPPAPRCLSATVTAIACLGMGRTEGAFTAFEQTTPSSINRTRLLPCPSEMIQ
jgi:hypothetical protein